MYNDIRHISVLLHDTLRGLPTGEDGVILSAFPVNNQRVDVKTLFLPCQERPKKRCYRLIQ